MKTMSKRAPGSLPRAVSDLVAEGGNVLKSDDLPVSERETTHVLVRRLRPSKSGRRMSRAPKA